MLKCKSNGRLSDATHAGHPLHLIKYLITGQVKALTLKGGSIRQCRLRFVIDKIVRNCALSLR